MRRILSSNNLFFLFLLLTFFFSSICHSQAEDNYSKALQLLEQGDYSKIFGDDAIGYFKDAFEENKQLGPKIADILIKYSDKLAAEGKDFTILGEDANRVLDDALKFDESVKNKVINRHIKFLKSMLNEKKYILADAPSRKLNHYDAGDQAFKIIQAYEATLPRNSANEKLLKLYKCMNTALSNKSHRVTTLTSMATKHAFELYYADRVRTAFDFLKEFSDIVDEDDSRAIIVHEFRDLANLEVSKGHLGSAVKILDELTFNFSEETTKEDIVLLEYCITNILQRYEGKFLYLYSDFKDVLSLRLFEDCDFHFLDENSDIEDEINAFNEIREPEETVYFYYDTGRILSDSRGALLTDEAIYWKNSIGDSKRLNYENIISATLVYEKGLSLTGWKLIFNGDEDLNIRLSRIEDEGLVPFIGALIYFVNLNSTKNLLSLDIPENELKILEGSIWERHNGVIITAAVVAAVTVTYYATKDTEKVKHLEAAVVHGLSSAAKATAKGGRFIGKKVKYAPTSIKEGTRGLVKSLKKFDIYKKGVKVGTARLKDFYDKKKIVKMPFVGHTSKHVTNRGFLRDKGKFWKIYKNIDKASLSKNNLNRINNGKSPIVDKKWINVYNKHKDFLGETLEHHHLNHGAKAIPLPETLHRGLLNSGVWHG